MQLACLPESPCVSSAGLARPGPTVTEQCHVYLALQELLPVRAPKLTADIVSLIYSTSKAEINGPSHKSTADRIFFSVRPLSTPLPPPSAHTHRIHSAPFFENIFLSIHF
ncbi:hypothetical protein ElyMa_000617100 [Elysia marginata]|uniref:Uncharacterized protein n=1 Tax=Elysia marginata TaxID=1093978 RepID=A0AAV4G949_9GAST|nr:hypothetical protein ElyMa_000617100 [Elysia marginata]